MLTPSIVVLISIGVLVATALTMMRRYPQAFLMFLGGAVLVVAVVIWCGPNSPSLLGFVAGAILSVTLFWFGYRAPRHALGEAPSELFLPTFQSPTPVARVVREEEVFGPWQFYVDAAASTVIVDLQAGGRYTQTIVPTCGERIACPGGAWTLDGPYVELTAYRSAVRETMHTVRWFFGQGKKDLVLWAKDDPQAETDLLGQRVVM